MSVKAKLLVTAIAVACMFVALLFGLYFTGAKRRCGRGIVTFVKIRLAIISFCRYIKYMSNAYDKNKSESNKEKHGRLLADAALFDWMTAVNTPDLRYDYGEKRYIAYGMIGERLHVLVWTPRPEGMRYISLRKANAREQKKYERIRNEKI